MHVQLPVFVMETKREKSLVHCTANAHQVHDRTNKINLPKKQQQLLLDNL